MRQTRIKFSKPPNKVLTSDAARRAGWTVHARQTRVAVKGQGFLIHLFDLPDTTADKDLCVPGGQMTLHFLSISLFELF